MTDVAPAFLAPSIDERELTCPACGAPVSVPSQDSPDHTIMTLMAVCDVLVVKALEKMGNEIVRSHKGRYNEIGDRPYYEAHTFWPVDDGVVSKALKDAWRIVPLILDTHGPYEFDAPAAVIALDQYVHDLAVTGSKHSINDMAQRLRVALNLPVFVIHPSIR